MKDIVAVQVYRWSGSGKLLEFVLFVVYMAVTGWEVGTLLDLCSGEYSKAGRAGDSELQGQRKTIPVLISEKL